MWESCATSKLKKFSEIFEKLESCPSQNKNENGFVPKSNLPKVIFLVSWTNYFSSEKSLTYFGVFVNLNFEKMTYRAPTNLGGYYNTDDHEYQHQHHPVAAAPYDSQNIQIDTEGQNGYYHSSTELHRFAQNADRYTTNVRSYDYLTWALLFGLAWASLGRPMDDKQNLDRLQYMI